MSEKNNGALSPNGLIVTTEFPVLQYESVHKIIVLKHAKHPLYEHYSGSWNALAYRFRATMDQKDYFISSLKEHGSAPPPEERYLQERTLFDFFNSAFSSFEAAFYGMYTIGAFIAPSHFSLFTGREQQKISPSRTRKAYENAFPSDQFLKTFTTLFADSKFQQLREIRNILTHRTAPGRRMYVSIGGEDAPVTEWKLNNVPINESIVIDAAKELSRLLLNLLTGCENFVQRHIK